MSADAGVYRDRNMYCCIKLGERGSQAEFVINDGVEVAIRKMKIDSFNQRFNHHLQDYPVEKAAMRYLNPLSTMIEVTGAAKAALLKLVKGKEHVMNEENTVKTVTKKAPATAPSVEKKASASAAKAKAAKAKAAKAKAAKPAAKKAPVGEEEFTAPAFSVVIGTGTPARDDRKKILELVPGGAKGIKVSSLAIKIAGSKLKYTEKKAVSHIEAMIKKGFLKKVK